MTSFKCWFRSESVLVALVLYVYSVPASLTDAKALLTDIQSGSNAETLIARLEDESARRVAQAVQLRSLRNALAPIAKLPAELLSQVFLQYALSSPLDLLYELQWARLMEVCRLWRAVGLSLEPAWSYILITSPRYSLSRLAIQLERSGSLPLFVKTYLNEPWVLDDFCSKGPTADAPGLGSMNFLAPARLGSLDLDGSVEVVDQWFNHCSADTFHPLLQELKIARNFQADIDISVLPRNLLQLKDGTPTLLHSIHLRNVNIDLSLPSYLTELILDRGGSLRPLPGVTPLGILELWLDVHHSKSSTLPYRKQLPFRDTNILNS